jgi:hypothetical protein
MTVRSESVRFRRLPACYGLVPVVDARHHCFASFSFAPSWRVITEKRIRVSHIPYLAKFQIHSLPHRVLESSNGTVFRGTLNCGHPRMASHVHLGPCRNTESFCLAKNGSLRITIQLHIYSFVLFLDRRSTRHFLRRNVIFPR